eukprot:CAMPEP_0196821118 /NCGR_PEP_ID=MMETSP1362-20130617/77858_1 /TAXON_ID=163516 /ORGANISM="Leptocylindrus danicus, Strain CCMP1856" /LENGTH=1158 /DNA_ID=CAMNT_0042200195 /DNA_START=65 /DNA_END=3538 /DNA_ORIENTATION=+
MRLKILFLLLSGMAITCDILIILTSIEKDPPEDDTDYKWIHKIFYLEVLAFIRLALLVPQFIKSVTGKRLDYPKTMHTILIGTIITALVHMVGIIVIDPTSVENVTYEPNEDMGTVWAALFLTIGSTILHISTLRVLRTTAPPVRGPGRYRDYVSKAEGHASKRLAYHYRKVLYDTQEVPNSSSNYGVDQYQLGAGVNISIDGPVNSADEAAGGGGNFMSGGNHRKVNNNGSTYISEIEVANMLTTPLVSRSPGDNNGGGDDSMSHGDDTADIYAVSEDGDSNSERYTLTANVGIMQRLKQLQAEGMHDWRCFPDDNGANGGTEFLSELIYRVEEGKRKWTAKLDQVSARLHLPINLNSNQHAHQSTFRYLLELFVYEGDPLPKLEKLWNDKIVGVEAQVELMFYIPQLCTFLIFGAFLNSRELEAFLLDKCSKNLFFAHRMYWFLMAWCLETKHTEKNEDERATAAGSRSMRRHASESELFDPGTTAGGRSTRSRHHRRTYSSGNSDTSKKFLPEDYRMILSLAHRVKACGEKAARAYLQHMLDTRNAEETPYEIPAFMQNIATTFVPENGGFPSSSHLETMHAKAHVGLWDANKVRAMLNCDAMLESGVSSLFNETPAFFQNLTEIADDLMFVDRERRTEALRAKLNDMDILRLPSNLVYVPFGEHETAVWRILPQESFALSTKERVPCIVTMECVRLNTSREDDYVRKWYMTPRHPQRHNTIWKITLKKSKDALRAMRLNRSDSRQMLRERGLSESLDLALSEEDDDPNETLNAESNANIIEADNASASMKTDIGFWASTNSMGLSRRNTEYIQDNSRSGMSTGAGSTTLYGSDGHSPPNSFVADDNAKSQTMRSHPPRRSPPLPRSSRRTSTRRNKSTHVVFKEDWSGKEERLRPQSCFGNHPGWHLKPVFVKSNDDLRQEQLASQLICRMASILAKAKVPVWLYPYQIIALSNRGGIIEAVPNTISIDSLKRNYPNFTSLNAFFEDHFSQDEDNIAGARANFVESIAAYSIVCYLLSIKDRHNGNILLDSAGHIVHIDFGFFFLSSPGKNTGFESAPFKLTSEYVDIMGGPHSSTFARFRNLCVKTFMELRRNCYQITLLVDMLSAGNEELPCFRGRPDDAISQLRDRFKLEYNDLACQDYVNGLINESLENW